MTRSTNSKTTPVPQDDLDIQLLSSSTSVFSPITNVQSNPSNIVPSLSSALDTQLSVAEAMVKLLENLGVKCAFGILGGAIAPLVSVMQRSPIEVFHFRHEGGAAFAAVESYFVSDRPTVVFTTTGPGITNALTGLFAARWEGAKVIFLSAFTSALQRGRWAFQETSAYTMPSEFFSSSLSLCHYAAILERGDELPEISHRLAFGLTRPGSFVAHISIPTTIQTSLFSATLPQRTPAYTSATASEEAITDCVKLLCQGPFAIWVGFGAREAAAEIRQLAENTGAAVMCSPRGKGIFPEDHPQFIGVTGFGGHESVLTYMKEGAPLRVLVLGTRLGEFTSFWNPVMVPSQGFIQVDIDPEVLGVAYPDVPTLGFQSEIGIFVKALLKHFPNSIPLPTLSLPQSKGERFVPRQDGLVRPEVLMDLIQRAIVERSDAVVMTEAGNSFAWGTNRLRFNTPGRYRVSTGFGSMGHAATGVVGAALARKGKAVAILGDGAMLMNSGEVSTAVKYQIPAVWIVLNDGCYNMVNQGMAIQKLLVEEVEIPWVDFVMIGRGMGAEGIRVEKESDLEVALETAIAATVPFIVDVVIDRTRPAPIGSRIQSLILQGTK